MFQLSKLAQLSIGLILTGVMAWWAVPAQAQSGIGANISIPPSADPGAIMNSQYMYFRMQREQPYLFRPITEKDSVPEEPLIIDEQGVLNQKKVQGQIILKTE